MQGDLFSQSPISKSSGSSSPKIDLLSSWRITLRFDHILVCVIAFLAAFVFIFSMGVEKGKGFAKKEMRAEREKRHELLKRYRTKLVEFNQATTQVLTLKGQQGEISDLSKAEKIVRLREEPSHEVPLRAEEVSTIKKSLPTPKIPGKYTIQMITYTTQNAVNRELEKPVLEFFGGLTGVQARLRSPGSQVIAQREQDARFHTKFIAGTRAPTESLPNGSLAGMK